MTGTRKLFFPSALAYTVKNRFPKRRLSINMNLSCTLYSRVGPVAKVYRMMSRPKPNNSARIILNLSAPKGA